MDNIALISRKEFQSWSIFEKVLDQLTAKDLILPKLLILTIRNANFLKVTCKSELCF